MIDFLYSIDMAVFYFCNQAIANPIFDVAMPVLTDLNKHWWGLCLFAFSWILLFLKGGKKGRIVATLLLLLVLMTDQFNSNPVKNYFHRPRPCHNVNGYSQVEHVRLLVDCGSGYSFPSSHAANNFAAAFFLSFFYRRWSWAFFLFASAVGFSRISVGVHYPSDVLGGLVIGGLCAAVMIFLWSLIVSNYPKLEYSRVPSQDTAGMHDLQ